MGWAGVGWASVGWAVVGWAAAALGNTDASPSPIKLFPEGTPVLAAFTRGGGDVAVIPAVGAAADAVGVAGAATVGSGPVFSWGLVTSTGAAVLTAPESGMSVGRIAERSAEVEAACVGFAETLSDFCKKKKIFKKWRIFSSLKT